MKVMIVLTLNDDSQVYDTLPEVLEGLPFVESVDSIGPARSAEPLPEWCPVCKTYHAEPGEKTDAGRLTRPCPALPADDPRNELEPDDGYMRLGHALTQLPPTREPRDKGQP